jgi:hypothetical protein
MLRAPSALAPLFAGAGWMGTLLVGAVIDVGAVPLLVVVPAAVESRVGAAGIGLTVTGVVVGEACRVRAVAGRGADLGRVAPLRADWTDR